jgi:hypothetical protein
MMLPRHLSCLHQTAWCGGACLGQPWCLSCHLLLLQHHHRTLSKLRLRFPTGRLHCCWIAAAHVHQCPSLLLVVRQASYWHHQVLWLLQ